MASGDLATITGGAGIEMVATTGDVRLAANSGEIQMNSAGLFSVAAATTVDISSGADMDLSAEDTVTVSGTDGVEISSSSGSIELVAADALLMTANNAVCLDPTNNEVPAVDQAVCETTCTGVAGDGGEVCDLDADTDSTSACPAGCVAGTTGNTWTSVSIVGQEGVSITTGSQGDLKLQAGGVMDVRGNMVEIDSDTTLSLSATTDLSVAAGTAATFTGATGVTVEATSTRPGITRPRRLHIPHWPERHFD